MVIFGYSKDKIVDLQQEIKLIKADIEILQSQIKSLKGYVYQKKIHLDENQENGLINEQNLNNSIYKTFL